jgi:tetratricopeptide (TPR) repeat protein
MGSDLDFPRRRLENRDLTPVLIALLVGVRVLAGGAPQSSDAAKSESKRLREAGLTAGYNLDYPEALEAFRAAIDVDPDDPAPHRLFAATLWIRALFTQGAVTADDYLGQARTSVTRTPPPPEIDKAFREHIQRAVTLAGRAVERNPDDADAHFQLGAAHSFLASYTATVEGRGLAGFGAARRAYDEHERVLALDAKRKDAGMVVGMYRYGVSTLSWPWRLVAGLAGFGGGRDRGLRMVEDAAAFESDVQTNALFALIVIYNREQRHADALRVIARLQRMYPRNRLLWLERGSTALRAGQGADARAALEEGLSALSRDSRPRAFGEEARWRYAYGTSLVLSGQIDAADRELRQSLALEGPAWLRGRVHKELGKVEDVRGNRVVAVGHYREAVRVGKAEHDPGSSDEATRLLKAAYRRSPEGTNVRQ